MTRDRRDQAEDGFLDAVLDEARGAGALPLSEGLSARLMADALAWQPRAAAPVPWWQRMRQALAEVGGLPGVAGVAAAGVAGIWIGVAPPASADGLVAGLGMGQGLGQGLGLSALIDGEASVFDAGMPGDLFSVIASELE